MRGRNYNGTTDYIAVDPTGWGSLTGDMTIAAVVYRNATGAVHNILLQNGTGTGDCGFLIDSNTLLIFSNATGFLSTTTIGVGTWFLCVSKASGTSTPRVHLFNYTTGVWVHENEGGAVPSFSSAGATNLYIGSYRGSADFYNGDIFATGAWAYNATDNEVEGLAFNLDSWFALPNMRLFVPLDGDVANGVPDLSGVGTGQTTINGTTNGTREAPIGFRRRADLRAFFFSATDSTVTGTLAVTLGATTCAADGTPVVTGTVGVTLGGTTCAATGTPVISGTVGVTLGETTSTAAGTPVVTGSLGVTLGDTTSAAAGDTTITGTLAANLGATTLAATGTPVVSGSTSALLGDTTAVITGTTAVTGILTALLGEMTLAGVGTPVVVGSLAQTLGAATLVAAGGSTADPQPDWVITLLRSNRVHTTVINRVTTTIRGNV